MSSRWAVAVLALLLVGSTIGTAQEEASDECPIELEGDVADEPGQQLADLVGEQESVVADELERRGFNATLENASNATERATIVDAELERIGARVEGLESCEAALVDARDEDEVEESEFREQVDTLEPAVADERDRLERAEDVAEDIPDRVREREDVEPERFDDLWTRIATLQSFVDDPSEPPPEDVERPDGTPATAPIEEQRPTSTTDDGEEQEETTPAEETTTEPDEAATTEPTGEEPATDAETTEDEATETAENDSTPTPSEEEDGDEDDESEDEDGGEDEANEDSGDEDESDD